MKPREAAETRCEEGRVRECVWVREGKIQEEARYPRKKVERRNSQRGTRGTGKQQRRAEWAAGDGEE